MSDEEFALRKKELELSIIEKQVQLKQLEIDKVEKENAANGGFKLTPVTGTIIVSLLGLTGTLLANFLQQRTSMEVEKRKTLFAILAKAQESSDTKSAAKILDFYIAMNLIEGEQGQFTKAIAEGDTSDLVPPVFAPTVRTPEQVYSSSELEIPAANADGSWEIKNNFLTGAGVSHSISPNTPPNAFADTFPDAIVFHGSFTNSMEATVKYLTRGDVNSSSHFVIGKKGEIVQLVPLHRSTWHAGVGSYDGRNNWNKSSIGIELINNGYLTKSGNEYVSFYGIKVSPENVVQATHKNETTSRYWEKYTPEQIASAKKLAAILIANYKINYVLGHDDISPGRKVEPGPAFPIGQIQEMIKK